MNLTTVNLEYESVLQGREHSNQQFSHPLLFYDNKLMHTKCLAHIKEIIACVSKDYQIQNKIIYFLMDLLHSR
jgi:hypothetical protein